MRAKVTTSWCGFLGLAAFVLLPAALAGQAAKPAPLSKGPAALPSPVPLEAFSYRSESSTPSSSATSRCSTCKA